MIPEFFRLGVALRGSIRERYYARDEKQFGPRDWPLQRRCMERKIGVEHLFQSIDHRCPLNSFWDYIWRTRDTFELNDVQQP
jgi:hypothetical protein